MANGMTVPYDIDAEEAIIGSIMLDGESIDSIIDIIEPNDFLHEDTRNIYKAIISIKSRSEAINQITVGHELERSGVSGLIGYMSHCVAITPTSLDIEHYANIIRRCAVYRELLGVASNITHLVTTQDPSVDTALDKCESMIQSIRERRIIGSRWLILGQPRMIETNPPRYIWNVNGKDLRLTLGEITIWGRFKNKVISELNFVPIKPKDWDNVINSLITHSSSIEAPVDASEEHQLKILIHRWFERMREATMYSDLSYGRHTIKEVRGVNYYFFKSTPLLDYLKKEYKRGINSEDLWVSVSKWSGIKHKIRVKTPTGSMPVDLWGIPISFLELDMEKKERVPDWF